MRLLNMGLNVLENTSLKPFNTFGIEASAEKFCAFHSMEELNEALSINTTQLTILGGGSNILLTRNVSGLVLRNALSGIRLLSEDDSYYIVEAMAGEVWHQFVMHCIAKGYAGVENLALIPGCVGAGPMQNIGAYGVELKDVFHSLTAFHIHDRIEKEFSLDECSFGYRESVFKRKEKGNWVITAVRFKLRKRPVFHTQYGSIEEELDKMQLDRITIKAVAQAVIAIRSSKLPDPKVLGNAGSFFKNPVVPVDVYNAIKSRYPQAPGYPIDEREVKVPAGWLIEQAGWKGHKRSHCGVHEKQALVLVNLGGASGEEIYTLSSDIIADIQSKFGIVLEREVNIL